VALRDAARDLHLEVATGGGGLPLLDDVAELAGRAQSYGDREVPLTRVEAGRIVHNGEMLGVRRRGVRREPVEVVPDGAGRPHAGPDLAAHPAVVAVARAVDHGVRAGRLVHPPARDQIALVGAGRRERARQDRYRCDDDDQRAHGTSDKSD
jgi:hypothetical protein